MPEPDTIIHAELLGKKYAIRHRDEARRYLALRDILAGAVRSVAARIRRPFAPRAPSPTREDFWALQDVSFEVRRGEVVGIIGRNGAGKSTLLKILSRITEPTTGRVTLHGRVASLLEVGTGFHPELSGRENILLNGSILGMSRAEIRKKFDAIVAFAEVEKFLDTPVKRYSSGMYVRLAFAVAAHLEPEILVVDEVLAVGDAAFQRKCLNKMQDIGQHGRTVLFVSHNMPAVTRLCPRTILLDGGRVIADGPSPRVVGSYLRSDLGTTAHREWPDRATAPGNDIVRLRAVKVIEEDGQVRESIDIRKPVGIQMEYEVLQDGHVLIPNIHFHNEDGIYLFISGEVDQTYRKTPRPVGRHVSTCWIPGNFLAEGSLIVSAAVSTINPVTIHVWEPEAVAFEVVDSMDGDTVRGDYSGHYPGVVRPMLRWVSSVTTRDKVAT
ncbi:ABC transporter [Planctomycetaceae bacterium SCGC AG-212-F19]|nr:ABC transporter [Planctomycetaceae bacterium SCGC AG-212-F19]